MKAGDVCVGYDLERAQSVDDDTESLREQGKLPGVVVVRKLYGGVATGDVNASKMRIWELNRLDVLVAETEVSRKARSTLIQAEVDGMDEEDFLREIEADRDMRQTMNLYKKVVLEPSSQCKFGRVDQELSGDKNDEEDDQQIRLEELLDGLALDHGPDDYMETGAAIGDERVEHFGEQARSEGRN